MAMALLPVAGNLVGIILAETVRTPGWLVGASLHAAAGVAIAVVSIELMPRVLETTPVWMIIVAFLAGSFLSLLLAHLVWVGARRPLGRARAWMVWVAVTADLFADGLMTGVGAAVTSGLGLLIAISQSVANIPGGFAACANLQSDGVTRRRRWAISLSLTVPVLLSAGLGFLLLRGTEPFVQNAALAMIVGVLLVTTVEDVVPEADAPEPKRWISTTAFAVGFVLLAALSALVG